MGLFKTSLSPRSSRKERKVLTKRRGTLPEQPPVDKNGVPDSVVAHQEDNKKQQPRAMYLPFREVLHDDEHEQEANGTVTNGGLWTDDRVDPSTVAKIKGTRTTERGPLVALPKEQRVGSEPLFSDIPSNYSKSDITTREERMLSDIPAEIWSLITSYLDPLDAANLAHTSKTLRYRLGSAPWKALNQISNHKHKVSFLTTSSTDHALPNHLFCFLCATYHLRTTPGSEKLQATYITTPIFLCPNAQELALPRTRLTHGRDLPFAHVQLATRFHRHGKAYGIPLTSLSRRWKDADSSWSHATRFHMHETGHLLMRVTSSTFVRANLQPVEERLLLYSRSDYAPYFSVCAHWKSGNLMPLCKCALSHVPAPPEGVVEQLRKGPRVRVSRMQTTLLAKQCDACKPLRRCRECPCEYLIQLSMGEDKADKGNPFKQRLSVVRYVDLGDGINVESPEWVAGNAVGGDFDSLGAIGGASLCSLFEAGAGGVAPGRQMLWLEERGEGEDVY